MLLVPWKSGKMLLWDVTVASTLADSYVTSAARGAGEVAKQVGRTSNLSAQPIHSVGHGNPGLNDC